MRHIVSLAAVVGIATGIALAGHITPHRAGYDYGLTTNAWWAAQRYSAPRP